MALMTPSIGERIAMHRTRRGLSQAQLAGRVGISLSYMKKIEQGVKPVTKFSLLIDFGQALGVRDLRDLTGQPFTLMPDGTAEHPSAAAVRLALTAPAPASPEPLLLDDLAARVERAWSAWQEGVAFRYAQVGQMLPELISAAQDAASTSPGPDRRRALAIASLTYQLARAWCKRVSEYDLSWIAADRAMQCARDADDPDLAAAAAWNLACILSARGYTTEARAVTDRAILDLRTRMTDAPTRRLSIYGALHQLAAIQAAREGNEDEAARLLATAEQLAARTGETNDFRTAFGPTNVAIHRTAVEMELGRSDDALRMAERVDLTRVATIERKLTHTVDMARAYAHRREDVAAVHMLARVLADCAEEVRHSVTIRETVRELMARDTAAIRGELLPLASTAGVIET